MAWKVWGLGSGPVQAALVVGLLSPADQGAWYVLSGLQRFQVLVDLGVGATLAMLVAQTTDLPRLGGLIRYSLDWHTRAAIVWITVAGPVGALWILHPLGSGWILPWLALVVATSLTFPASSLFLTLEARGRVAEVYEARVIQGIRARVLAWGMLAVGLGAWAQAAERLSVAIDAGRWLHRRAPELREAVAVAAPVDFHEVWPFQWRIAASAVGGALPHALIIPIAVARFGTTSGGQLGAAFAVTAALYGLAWAALAPALPRVGALLAAERRVEAWRVHRDGAVAACGLYVAACALFVAVLAASPERVAENFTSPTVTAFVGASMGLRLLREVLAAWCRADLRPVTWPVDLAEGLACALAFVLVGADLRGLVVAFLGCSAANAAATLIVGRERR